MKKDVLKQDHYSNSGGYQYDDFDDELSGIHRESGRAVEMVEGEEQKDDCMVSLIYGSDPWVGVVASGIARSEDDLKVIVKGWCEKELVAREDEDGRSLLPPEQKQDELF